MARFIIAFVLCYFSLKTTIAQSPPNLDSIKKVALRGSDSSSFQAYQKLINTSFFINTDSTLSYLAEFKYLNKFGKFPDYHAFYLKSMGNAYFLRSNFSQAMYYYQEALKIFENLDTTSENYYKSAGLLHNIGNIYGRWYMPNKAIDYYRRAMYLNRKANNLHWLGNNLVSISTIYLEHIRDFDSCLYFCKSALLIADTLENQGLRASILMNIAAAEIENKQYDKAEIALAETISILEKNRETAQLPQAYGKLGLIKFHQNEYKLSEKLMLKSIELYQSTKSTDGFYGIYANLAELYSKRGDFLNAHKYLTNAMRLRDSIFSKNEEQNIADSESRYALFQEQIANEKLTKSALLKEIEISKSKNQILVLLIITLFISVLAIGFYYNFQKNRKNLKVIAAQYREILSKKNELEFSNELLNSANEENKSVLNMIAHDLRTPLTKIKMQTEMLLLKPLTEKDEEANRKVIKYVDQAANMLQNILDIQTLVLENDTNIEERVTLKTLFGELIDNHNAELTLKKIRVQLKGNTKLALNGEKFKLQRIFENLLSNAIKYAPRESTISINCTAGEELISVLIEDQGPGFSSNDLELLYQPFKRLSAKPTAGEQSVGLGLAIVKKLALELGASISLVSSVGESAKFKLDFPVS